MNEPIIYVDHQDLLSETISTLSSTDSFTIDLEFDKNCYRYGFNLCLVQIYDGETCYLIDPLSTDVDIEILFPVLENESIQKVCFAFDEDLRLLHSLGCFPKNLYDLSIASKLLNYPSTSLTNILADQLGINTGSSSQQSNWFKRPLDSNQLHYAANDVIHLFKLQTYFDEKAAENGVQDWISEENSALNLLDYSNVDHNDFIKEKDRSDFTEVEWHIFKKLLEWQNEKGKELNRPAYQIVPKSFLMELAKDSRKLMDWNTARGIYRSIQTDATKNHLIELIKDTTQEAEQLKLSNSKSATLSLSSDEHKKLMAQKSEINRVKNSYFKPIKEHIEENHGSEIASFLLSNRIIAEMVTGKMDHLPDYRKELFLKCADDLSIEEDHIRKYF
tara:strand:- start:21976 stop:23142 length:1167 start_codon:yes stop_codon:yes gene_type:complete